jgi:hypothetical protein
MQEMMSNAGDRRDRRAGLDAAEAAESNDGIFEMQLTPYSSAEMEIRRAKAIVGGGCVREERERRRGNLDGGCQKGWFEMATIPGEHLLFSQMARKIGAATVIRTASPQARGKF